MNCRGRTRYCHVIKIYPLPFQMAALGHCTQTTQDLLSKQLNLPQISLLHHRIIEQRCGIILQSDEAAFHYISALADVQCQLGVLFHQENGDALRCNSADGREDFLHHEGCESHAGLVQQQQFGAAH